MLFLHQRASKPKQSLRGVKKDQDLKAKTYKTPKGSFSDNILEHYLLIHIHTYTYTSEKVLEMSRVSPCSNNFLKTLFKRSTLENIQGHLFYFFTL